LGFGDGGAGGGDGGVLGCRGEVGVEERAECALGFGEFGVGGADGGVGGVSGGVTDQGGAGGDLGVVVGQPVDAVVVQVLEGVLDDPPAFEGEQEVWAEAVTSLVRTCSTGLRWVQPVSVVQSQVRS